MTYVFSQIFAILAYIALGLSFFTRDTRKILILNLTSTACFLGQYIFLSAYGAIFTNLIGIFRCVVFYIEDRKNIHNNFWTLILFIVLNIAVSITAITSSWVEILAIIASLLLTYNLWKRNVLLYRWLAVICSCIWITYNSIHMTLFGIIGESILLVVEIVSVIRYYVYKNKMRPESENSEQSSGI